MEKCTVPSNKNAQNCVKNVMKYLSDITFKQVLTGQHTQTTAQEELEFIEKNTGKLPALVGFELLSYSPNINYFDTDEECMTEVQENFGTLKNAWEWAKKGGLLTFTWHWFSPLGGKNKSFFTKYTDFDPEKAVIEGTAENLALIRIWIRWQGFRARFATKKLLFCGDLFTRAKGIGLVEFKRFRTFEKALARNVLSLYRNPQAQQSYLGV